MAVARARKPRAIWAALNAVKHTQDGGDRRINEHSRKHSLNWAINEIWRRLNIMLLGIVWGSVRSEG